MSKQRTKPHRIRRLTRTNHTNDNTKKEEQQKMHEEKEEQEKQEEKKNQDARETRTFFVNVKNGLEKPFCAAVAETMINGERQTDNTA